MYCTNAFPTGSIQLLGQFIFDAVHSLGLQISALIFLQWQNGLERMLEP